MQLAIVAAGFTPGEADGCGARWRPGSARAGSSPFEQRAGRGHARARLRRGASRGRIFQQILGFGEYGFPEVARRELRAARLRLGLAQAARAGRLLLRAPQQPADGLLRAGAARARRARARRRGARRPTSTRARWSRRSRPRAMAASRCGSASTACAGSRARPRSASSPPAPEARFRQRGRARAPRRPRPARPRRARRRGRARRARRPPPPRGLGSAGRRAGAAAPAGRGARGGPAAPAVRRPRARTSSPTTARSGSRWRGTRSRSCAPRLAQRRLADGRRGGRACRRRARCGPAGSSSRASARAAPAA